MNTKWLSTSFLNVFFRFLTLGAKLLLSIFLIDFISTEEFGAYGIIAKTLTLSIVLLGLDFYTYSGRNILQGNKALQGQKIRDQFIFYGLGYLILLPALLSIFYFNIIAWENIAWFYLLLILDHLSQELYRLLLLFKRPVIASALFFIKVGLWVLPLFIFWLVGLNQWLNLQSILALWTIFEIIGILFGLYFFKQLPFKITWKEKINWQWIRNGIWIALPFFVGTVAANVVEFADIYMIKAHFGEAGDFQYGIYGFFVGIGNIVQMFVQSAILIVFAPKLIESFSQDKGKYKTLHRQMSIQNIVASLGIGVLVFLFLLPLVKYIGKTEIINHYNLIFWLVGAKILLNISMIYHYHLYVRHKDRKIVLSMIFAAIVNIVLNLILIPQQGIYGAAIATFISFLFVLIIKYIFAQKVLREEKK